ncbi:ATP-binding protein [Lewinella sp. JB7]|uniref:ATP-binding protein n=1 Tax=Lewinella sp. JB7 TaxID=2962887 RepID=UPI0020C9C1C8|nr:ATP-binding protein [Lewinella sp. JB7]MCP9234999.1 ATP-binding protein [Lewinella sp. JB7]
MTDPTPLSNQAISRRIEEHAGKFFEVAPCGYVFTSATGDFLRINKTFCDWLGYSPAELVGSHSLIDLVTRGSRIFFETHFFPVLNLQNSVEDINLTLQCKNGSRLPVLITATRHHDDAGRFLFTSMVIINFTVRKKYETELLVAKKRAESSDRAKSYFLSTISHEVLTPLNAIVGTSDLLKTTGLNAHQAHLQSILANSATHILQLFKNILVISKVGLGKLRVANAPFDLHELVRSVVNSFHFDSRNRGLDLDVTVDEALPATLVGDPTLISQLLTNLIGNAVKFTPDGSVATTVKVLDSTEKRVRIEVAVTDTGIGIAPDRLQKLFTPFTQASEDIHAKYGGSGLGLAISSSILEKLDSRMEVFSEEGKGSRFSFELSLPVADPPDAAGQPGGELPPIRTGRVLLVEDNETNAFLVSRYFRRWQVPFDLAPNGAEAIRHVQANHFDLILMDLRMPVMDGYEAATRIRKLSGPRSEIPIVAFSASASFTISERMREARIDDFLLKPFDPARLHGIISRYLGGPVAQSKAPTTMPFITLREAFDHDARELAAFSVILQRELRGAATELDTAITAGNARAVGDLKHKLKTSLQLLTADRLTDQLARITQDLKNGTSVTAERRQAVVNEVRSLADRLGDEKW